MVDRIILKLLSETVPGLRIPAGRLPGGGIRLHSFAFQQRKKSARSWKLMRKP